MLMAMQPSREVYLNLKRRSSLQRRVAQPAAKVHIKKRGQRFRTDRTADCLPPVHESAKTTPSLRPLPPFTKGDLPA